MPREILVPVGFRLPLDVLKRIDERVAALTTSSDRWHRVTRSEVIVEALRKALPPTQSDEQQKKKKPAARKRAA